jgi:hypothetical protein
MASDKSCTICGKPTFSNNSRSLGRGEGRTICFECVTILNPQIESFTDQAIDFAIKLHRANILQNDFSMDFSIWWDWDSSNLNAANKIEREI